MYSDRIGLYKQLEKKRSSHVIAYITGDRRGLETKIHTEVLKLFMDHFDSIGIVDKITLFLYTSGGLTLAAWSLVNLIRQFCQKEFEVIVPEKAHSAGTLICLGADRIVMTKQASLGPIDPAVNTPLNPALPNTPPDVRYPVSVEDINGFIELAKAEFNINDGKDMTAVLEILSRKVDPLVLGKAYRTRNQIRMLGEKLLSRQVEDTGKINQILDFLCSQSGSHDYTIYRREARNLGLNVETPNDKDYLLYKSIYNDIADDLQLIEPLNETIILGDQESTRYTARQALIESIEGGSHSFERDVILNKQKIKANDGTIHSGIQGQVTFNGWRHYQPSTPDTEDKKEGDKNGR